MPTRPKRFKMPQVAQKARRVEYRPPYHERGYGHHHRQIRERQLRRHPVCATPGCGQAATDVDHVQRISEGGARFDTRNLQSLCHACHSRKTKSEGLRP